LSFCGSAERRVEVSQRFTEGQRLTEFFEFLRLRRA